MTTVHIIGAGLAGLAAAVRLARQGVEVRVWESASQAGGRCRSYVDKPMGRLIDNGNHLLMSGNRSALAYLDEIGARDSLMGPSRAIYPFVDLKTGARWTVEPGSGRLPTWILNARTRVPGTTLGDYLSVVRLLLARQDATVADAVPTRGALYERFWEPLTIAALNTTAERGAASLLKAVLKETFLKGEAACRPLIARDGLGSSFIAPALALLERNQCTVRFNERLRAFEVEGRYIRRLDFGEEQVEISGNALVILAVPAFRAVELVPGLEAPGDGETIVNAHFRLSEAVATPIAAPLLGLINATAHWIFVRGDIVSVTISAAGEIAERDSDELTEILWRETASALELGDMAYEAARLIKEKRATFDQSPAGVRRRPGPETALANLLLAGDWTDTGLPATIESAIRSGHTAAALALERLGT